MKKTAGAVLIIACALFIVLFLAAICFRAFSIGICCADDAAMAAVAKNLASGFGYSLPLTASGLSLFDPGISTGPTMILPAAALIIVFGADPRLPGVIAVLIITALIGALYIAHRDHGGRSQALIYVAAFVFICFAVTPYHFEQWNALLGEIPAALLVVLAITLSSADHLSLRTFVIVGALLGLAFLAKFISAFGIIVAGLILIHRARQERRWSWLLWAVAAGAAPILLFEAWKVFALGPRGYLTNFADTVSFIRSQGVSRGHVVDRIANNAALFKERFNFSFLIVPASEALLITLIWHSSEQRLRRAAITLCGAATLHLVYWLCLSAGWPRYAIVGLVYHAAAMAIFPFVLRAYPPVQIVSVIILLAHVGRPDAMRGIITGALDQKLVQRPHQIALRHAVAFVRPLLDSNHIVSTSWQAGMDFAYMLPPGSVSLFNANFAQIKQVVLVQDKRFAAYESAEANTFAKSCPKVLFREDSYVVAHCN